MHLLRKETMSRLNRVGPVGVRSCPLTVAQPKLVGHRFFIRAAPNPLAGAFEPSSRLRLADTQGRGKHSRFSPFQKIAYAFRVRLRVDRLFPSAALISGWGTYPSVLRISAKSAHK
jgi:hypothetical protein